jgi:hypothetical protein
MTSVETVGPVSARVFLSLCIAGALSESIHINPHHFLSFPLNGLLTEIELLGLRCAGFS